MSNLMDDDNFEEFRGGTLQLNREQQAATGAQDWTRLPPDSEPAILTGADAVSPITMSPPANERIVGNRLDIIPQYHLPFAFENAQDYFTHRNGLVEAAIDECNSTLVFPAQDGQVLGSWLLTEISLWDNEKERLVTLTTKCLFIIKYDFITLRQLECRKVFLERVDTLVLGDLVYPPSSLVPRLNGLATGVSSVVRDCILDRFSQPQNTSPKINLPPDPNTKKFGPIDLKNFESRNRNMRGVRAMWNQGKPLPFMKKWNPFDKDIPLNTFTSHPLYYHKDLPEGSSKNLYDVEHFGNTFKDVLEGLQNNQDSSCIIQHAPIVLTNYIGLTSLVHNKNALGFFKVRGKFSF